LTPVLTIAGFDPSSGAGVTADLMVFAAHRLFGTSCITALTVQSTLGVRGVEAVSAKTVAETLSCLEEDLPPAGIKIGMLATSDNVTAVAEYLDRVRRTRGAAVPVVLDPVIQSNSGAWLLEESGLATLREKLLPLVDWVTPNIAELALLTGRTVESREAVPDACKALQDQMVGMRSGQPVGVFAKGGHLEQPDDYLLGPAAEGVWIRGERVNTSSTHGTGCALSSAFLSRLVLGHTAEQSGQLAKEYVAGALRNAVGIGSGRGPMNHLWELFDVQDAEIRSRQ